MVKYRLIKEYPDSPKLGSIIKPISCGYYNWFVVTGDLRPHLCMLLTIKNPSDFPEFWEKVEDRDYEILSYECLNSDGSSANRRQIFNKNSDGSFSWSVVKYSENTIKSNPWKSKEGGYVIHSIKRLSDGEIFSVGDKVTYIDKSSYSNYIIGDFFIKKDKLLVRSEGFLICEYLEDIKKAKQPLFITDDGKELFLGDTFYSTDTKYTENEFIIRPYKIDEFFNKHIYKNSFSTKEAAQKWIDENKPKYSKKQINHSINELFSPELSRDGSVFGDVLKEGYRTAFFKYLENEQT